MTKFEYFSFFDISSKIFMKFKFGPQSLAGENMQEGTTDDDKDDLFTRMQKCFH